MYKTVLSMAWRNAFIRPARSILVLLMIALSMSFMLALQGLYDGMADSMIDKNKRSATGDVSIYAKGYLLNREFSYTLKNSSTILEQLSKRPDIKAMISRLEAEGLAATARKSSFASLQGIELLAEEKFGGFSSFLKKGTLDLSNQGAIIGLELSKKLKVKLGSKLIFSRQDRHGEITSLALRVKGIVQTTNIKLDNTALFIDKQTMHEFLSLPLDETTHIALKSSNPELSITLSKIYPHLDIQSFLQLQPMMKMMQEMMLIFNSITFFIVMGVVFIGILGVMYVSILDRIREFGILVSIGMQYRHIAIQIFFEAFFLGFIGYVLGALLGLGFLLYLQNYGLDLSSFSDALEMWGYESVLYGSIKSSYFTNTFFAISCAAVLSIILPLSKIKKSNPIEVIKADK